MRMSLPRDKILEYEEEEAREKAENSQREVEVLCREICNAASSNDIGDSWQHGAADESEEGPLNSRILPYDQSEYTYGKQDFDEESDTSDGNECYGRIPFGRELGHPAHPDDPDHDRFVRRFSGVDTASGDGDHQTRFPPPVRRVGFSLPQSASASMPSYITPGWTSRPELEMPRWLSEVADDYSSTGASQRGYGQYVSARRPPSSSYSQRDPERENDPWKISKNVM